MAGERAELLTRILGEPRRDLTTIWPWRLAMWR